MMMCRQQCRAQTFPRSRQLKLMANQITNQRLQGRSPQVALADLVDVRQDDLAVTVSRVRR
jgi:hypothetical protein